MCVLRKKQKRKSNHQNLSLKGNTIQIYNITATLVNDLDSI